VFTGCPGMTAPQTPSPAAPSPERPSSSIVTGTVSVPKPIRYVSVTEVASSTLVRTVMGMSGVGVPWDTPAIHGGRASASTLFTAPGVLPSGLTEACQLRGVALSAVGRMTSIDGPRPSGVTGQSGASS